MSDDLVSRQAVADWLQRWIGYLDNDMIARMQYRVVDIPSAESEHKKGEWIDYTKDGYVECPFCHSATNCDGDKDELHFCFSCGADMRGEQE